MKKPILLFYLLIPLLGFSQLNVSIQPTSGNCPGSGSVSITINNATQGYQYSYDLQLVGSNSADDRIILDNVEATTTPFTQTFETMSSGSWSLNITEKDNGGNSTTNELNNETFVIDSPTTNTFDVTTTKVCEDATVEIEVTSGSFTSYYLENRGTGDDYGPQNSPIFTEVKAGDYRVFARNICYEGTSNEIIENITQDISVTTYGPSNYEFGRQSTYGRAFDALIACDLVKHNVKPYLNGNFNLPADRYPLQITYKVYNTSDNEIFNSSYTLNRNEDLTLELPYGTDYRVEASLVDACGKGTEQPQVDIMGGSPNISLQTRSGNCGGEYFYYDFKYMSLPITITFDSYPTGFDPSAYNDTFSPGQYSAEFTQFENGSSLKRILFGATDNILPEGNYNISFESSCDGGISITDQFNIRNSLNIYGYDIPACEEGMVSAKIYLSTRSQSTQKGDFIDVEFTAGPGDSSQYPMSLNSYIKNGAVLIPSLQPGTYTIETTDNSCNFTGSKELTFTDVEETNFNSNITYNCSSFNYEYNVQTNTRQAKFTFEYYNETTNQWDVKDIYSYNNQTNTINVNNMTNIGNYRLIMNHRYFDPTTTNSNDFTICDAKVLDEFYYPGSAPKVFDYYINSCVPNNTFDLIIDATGVGLNYEIISKDGDISFTRPSQSSPVFQGLEAGTYTVRMEDDCNNTLTSRFRVQEIKTPRILAENLCDNEQGTLRTSGLSQFTTTWTDENDQSVTNSRITSSANVLTFNPYDESTDLGTYVANISYPGIENCAPLKSEITLTTTTSNAPEAGNGSTINLSSETVAGPINLFDYLTGYDAFGEWSEVTNSNLQRGDSWFGEFAPSGTYIFKYTVHGTCQNQDEATVTINYTSVCNRPFNNNPAVNFTEIGISNLENPNMETWLNATPNGFLALQSKTKGFTITRLQDPENSIANPIEGMMVFDIDDENGNGCLKLYNGLTWKCIKKACNN